MQARATSKNLQHQILCTLICPGTVAARYMIQKYHAPKYYKTIEENKPLISFTKKKKKKSHSSDVLMMMHSSEVRSKSKDSGSLTKHKVASH